MGDWALLDGQGSETAGVNTAASTGVAVTAGAVNTKGAWTELVAATARPGCALLVTIRRGHTAGADWLIDIGTGPAGAETVLIPNLKGDNGSNQLTRSAPVLIPISVPAGTRIAARAQCTTAAAAARVQVTVVYGSWLTPAALGRVTDYGTSTADSGGTSIDPGAVAHTKGSWTQITAATTASTRAILIGIGNQNNGSRTNADWLVDIGIGSPGTEMAIIADQHVEASASDDIVSPTFIGPIPLQLPAGTRISARAQCSILDAADRLFDVIVYAID